MAEPPDVAALAVAALAALDVPGQALVVWEDGAVRTELTAVVDGRAGAATVRGSDVARAAKQAVLRARQMRALPAPPLPAPAPAGTPPRPEDPRWAGTVGAESTTDGVDVRAEPGAARVAVASSTGVRATETRRWLAVSATATAADGR